METELKNLAEAYNLVAPTTYANQQQVYYSSWVFGDTFLRRVSYSYGKEAEAVQKITKKVVKGAIEKNSKRTVWVNYWISASTISTPVVTYYFAFPSG